MAGTPPRGVSAMMSYALRQQSGALQSSALERHLSDRPVTVAASHIIDREHNRPGHMNSELPYQAKAASPQEAREHKLPVNP